MSVIPKVAIDEEDPPSSVIPMPATDWLIVKRELKSGRKSMRCRVVAGEATIGKRSVGPGSIILVGSFTGVEYELGRGFGTVDFVKVESVLGTL